MELGDFRKLVMAYARTHGQSYIPFHKVGDLDAHISRQLQRFTTKAKCLYDDAVTLTLTASTATYDLLSTSIVSKRVAFVDYVVVNNIILRKFDGWPGSTSVDELNKRASDYRTATAAQPDKWVLVPPHTLRLIPKPASAYSNNYIAGWLVHPDLTVSGTKDSTSITIPDEYLDGAAAFCAAYLLSPNMNAEGRTHVSDLLAIAQGSMDEAEAHAVQMIQGPTIRGRLKRGQQTYSLR